MSKLRADSKWSGLTEEQRDTVEGWLFEEKISYREALERAEKEFGMTASLSSLARFYQKLAFERVQAEVLGLPDTAAQLEKPTLDLDDLGGTAITLITNRLIHTALQKPDNVKELVSLARVLIANESIEVRKKWIELEEDRREQALQDQMWDLKMKQASRENFQVLFKKMFPPKSQPATSSESSPETSPPVANGQP